MRAHKLQQEFAQMVILYTERSIILFIFTYPELLIDFFQINSVVYRNCWTKKGQINRQVISMCSGLFLAEALCEDEDEWTAHAIQ